MCMCVCAWEGGNGYKEGCLRQAERPLWLVAVTSFTLIYDLKSRVSNHTINAVCTQQSHINTAAVIPAAAVAVTLAHLWEKNVFWQKLELTIIKS